MFLVLPTVNMKDLSVSNENILKTKTVQRFQYTFNLEKGILGDRARIYCPLYRQKTMGGYMNDQTGETNGVNIVESAGKC